MLLIRPFLYGLCVLLLASCSALPDTRKIPSADASQQIHLVYHHWHTSILLPAHAVRAHSRYMKELAEGQEYIRVGWGDGVYFTGKDKSFGSATRALLISRYSALQVLTYKQDPFADIPAETHTSLAVTEDGLRRLIRYVDDSFVLADGHLEPLPGFGENIGSFYAARGHYGLFSNCNTWSGRALQAAGLPIRSRLQLTAKSVFEQANAISIYQRNQSRESIVGS